MKPYIINKSKQPKLKNSRLAELRDIYANMDCTVEICTSNYGFCISLLCSPCYYVTDQVHIQSKKLVAGAITLHDSI